MIYKALVLSTAVASASAIHLGLPQTWAELHEFNGGGSDDSFLQIFAKFKQIFGKTYANASTENLHYEVFAQRVKEILDFNTAGSHSYRKGITRFADMTSDMRRSYVMEGTPVADKKSKARPTVGTPVSKPLANAGDATFCDLSQFATSIKDQVNAYAYSIPTTLTSLITLHV